MKVLICGFNGLSYDNIVAALAHKYGSELTILISTVHHRIEGLENIQEYNFQDFALGEHKNIDFKNMKPLDAEIIEQMAEAQSIYLRLLDRLEIKLGKKLSYDKRRYLFEVDLRILNHLISKYKIDLCVFDYIPHIGFDYLLYELCRLKGIRTVMQCYALAIPYKTVSRFFLENIREPLPGLDNCYNYSVSDNLSPRMQDYLDYYRGDRTEITSFVAMDVYEKKQNKFLKYLKSTIRMIKKRDRRLVPAIKLRTKEFYNLREIKKYVECNCQIPSQGEQYLYFPLHYQPECTSLPMGFEYGNQILVIDMITALLPENVLLYIKPHPNPSLTVKKQYYQEINKRKQARLLPFNANTYDLIDNSLAVVTLTGTAGWEAIVREKPVLMFGHYFYQYAPGVFRIENMKDCEDALDFITRHKFQFDMSRLKIFLQRLDTYLVEGFHNDEYSVIYKIDQDKNEENTIKGYIDFIDSSEHDTEDFI